MNKKQYVQKSLGYLTKGYIELMENISKKNIGIPNELIQGLSNLELIGIMHNETFPTTFNNFYNLIKIPIGKWNYEFIKESIDGLGIEEYALYQESWQESDDYACEFDEDYDEDIDVLFGAKEILRVLTSNSSTLDIEESFRDEVFYKLVKLSSEEEYKIWRDGTEHNLIRTRDFEAPGFFKGINEKALKILKDEMYEKINENTQVHRIKNKTKPVIIRCSVCGTPMERYGKKHLKCPIAKCNIRKDLLRLSLHSYNDTDSSARMNSAGS